MTDDERPLRADIADLGAEMREGLREIRNRLGRVESLLETLAAKEDVHAEHMASIVNGKRS